MKEKVLYLTLTRKWYDMIASGEKKEEYRELKPFWIKRLLELKEFPDYVHFTNGYGKHRPQVRLKFIGMRVGVGKREWGASGNDEIIIRLGKITNSTP